MAVTITGGYAREIAAVDEAAQQWMMAGGTDKQVSWAKDLRRQYVVDALATGFRYYERRHENPVAWRQNIAAQVAERVSRGVNAKFWIENRFQMSSTQMGRDVQSIIVKRDDR